MEEKLAYSGMQVHYDFLKEQISSYNNAMKISRKSHLFSVTNESFTLQKNPQKNHFF